MAIEIETGDLHHILRSANLGLSRHFYLETLRSRLAVGRRLSASHLSVAL